MAIVFRPKTEYKLLSEHHSSQDKVVVHVKLTDSCLKALQDYQNAKGYSEHKPSIKFSGQDGTISIPTKKSSPAGDVRQFRFGCSNLQSLGHGCLDVIQQPRDGRTLQSIGSIMHKINVRATDDSYKMTRDKMKVAEEERSSVRTKIIKTPTIGGKKRNQGGKQRANMLMNVKRNMQNPQKASQNPPKASNGPSKSARDRVIHLLAIRPYKKLELFDRLRKDGVTLRDRNVLTNILQQVAVINNNQYILMKHLYSEIQADTWPYYTDEERLSVSSKLQSPSTEEETPIPPSIPKTSPVKRRESTSNKRPQSSTPYSAPAKKQRISHVVNTNNNITKGSPDSHKPSHKVAQHNLSPDSKQDKDENKALNRRKEKKTCSALNGGDKEDETDYKRKYPPIETYEQRVSYKRDFQKEYEEYIQLRNKIDSVTKKFTELKGNLKRCPRDSEERQNIERQILRSYSKHQQDPSWERSRKRCQDLHAKLAYIKELIRQFDDKRTHEANPDPT